ncbi:MAG: 7TM diverse intracellular signaling domain-containing protein [Pseudohongiellaceae bacterium]
MKRLCHQIISFFLLRRLNIQLFIVACLLGVYSQVLQAQSVAITTEPGPQAITANLEYYEDASEALSIDDVLNPGFSVNFLPHNRDIFHFGITSAAYWIRFKLDWSEVPTGTARILEFGPPKIVAGVIRGGIELYAVDDNGTASPRYTLGNLTNPRELKTLSRGFAILLDESFGDEFYLRITSARPLRLPINLWSIEEFGDKSIKSDLFLGLQYGVLLAMVFYNLFLFFSIRENSYLYYVLAISTQAAFIFLDSKHLRYLIGDAFDGGWLIDLAERNVYPALVITTLLFQRSLLRIWENNIKLDKTVLGLIAGFGLVILFTLIPNEKVFQYLFVVLLIISIPTAFYTNLDAIKRGNATAVLHMTAISVFLSGVIILMLLQLWPSFPSNAVTSNAYNFGLIAQALLLSLSLSYRYNQIKQEKEDAQRLAINNLVKSEEIKDDLLANVSHELRTPLFGINGLAQAALEEIEKNKRDTTLVSQNLELIRTSGDRLTKLVNDLLDFSSSKEDATYVKFRPVDLHSVVNLVIAVCQPLIGNKNIVLRTDIDPELPLVSGDEDRLQQILVNLTSNAVKFTYTGEVLISAKATSDFNVKVMVRDTGIGIHKTDHETIFKTFEKLPSQQMNASGIGLGLPLAKRMVEMHRSELNLASELDVGSTFSFNLRVSLDQTRAVKEPNLQKQMIRRADYLEQANKESETPKLRSEQETTILVVDDDEINRVVMGQQLEEFNVIKCSNGLDALTTIEEEKPDLVLLDLMMPGLNGYEVCQKIRQKFSQIELPVILVTAKNHLEDLTQGFKTGANDYLAKPFHGEELRSRVENQLRLSLLHKVNEDNVRLRSQIETYVQADSELRSSRFRLQQVLESITAGFVAFELPGKIFTLNQRAAELLGSDRETLMGQNIESIFSDSETNNNVIEAISQWEHGESNAHQDRDASLIEQDDESTGLTNLNVDIEVVYPYNGASKSTSRIIEFSSKLKLFGNDEGTGVLFLEDAEPEQNSANLEVITDTVELVSILGQAQQNIRRIGTRLSVMTPSEISNHPAMFDKLSGIEDLINYIDEQLPSVSSEGEYRQQLVTLMRAALHTWEVTTQKSKIELAEESNIWAVSIDDGRLRTRTFDRYLRLEQLPKIPRWREVVRTAYFVLSNPAIEAETRASLESELEKTKSILKKAAIS